MVNIVFDIGGTNMRIAVAQNDVLGEIKKVPTPQDPKEAIAMFAAIARELAGGEKIEKAAGCIRGVIFEGKYWKDMILSKWEGIRLPHKIEDALQTPVIIKNDCAVIGLGENHKGAGKGSKIMAYITVSTGVNGARIDNGEIDNYVYGFEIGRQLIGDTMLEDLVSGTAVRKIYGVEPKDLDSLDERNKLADTLALGLYNTVLHWSPGTIVLGGSMIVGKNPIPLERLEKSLAARLAVFPRAPHIKMAELGDNGGLIGGMILAEQQN
ncbi:MAG: ROK family protein [Minisyncoccia bacterium]